MRGGQRDKSVNFRLFTVFAVISVSAHPLVFQTLSITSQGSKYTIDRIYFERGLLTLSAAPKVS